MREATGGAGADVALNLVGGTLLSGDPALARAQGPRRDLGYVDGSHHAEIDLNAVHANRFEIFGISNSKATAEERAEAKRNFERDIMPTYIERRMAPLIDRVFGFDELPAAKAHMEAERDDRQGGGQDRVIVGNAYP